MQTPWVQHSPTGGSEEAVPRESGLQLNSAPSFHWLGDVGQVAKALWALVASSEKGVATIPASLGGGQGASGTAKERVPGSGWVVRAHQSGSEG